VVVRRQVPLRELKEVAGTDVRGVIYFEPPPSFRASPYFQQLSHEGVYKVFITVYRDRGTLRDSAYENELLLEKDGKWKRYRIEHTVFRGSKTHDQEFFVVEPL